MSIQSARFLDRGDQWLFAPFLILGILLVACDRKIMKNQPSSMLSRVVVGLTTLLMFVAAGGMFVF